MIFSSYEVSKRSSNWPVSHHVIYAGRGRAELNPASLPSLAQLPRAGSRTALVQRPWAHPAAARTSHAAHPKAARVARGKLPELTHPGATTGLVRAAAFRPTASEPLNWRNGSTPSGSAFKIRKGNSRFLGICTGRRENLPDAAKPKKSLH